MCVWIFCTMYLIPRRTRRDIFIKVPKSLCKNTLSKFSDFNETGVFSIYVHKIFHYQISWKLSWWKPRCSMQTDRCTHRHDVTKLIVAFSQFCKAPPPPKKTRRNLKKNKIYMLHANYLPRTTDYNLEMKFKVIRILTARTTTRFVAQKDAG